MLINGSGLGLGSKACATLSGNDLPPGALQGSPADTKPWRPRTTTLLYPVVPVILCPYLHWDPSSLRPIFIATHLHWDPSSLRPIFIETHLHWDPSSLFLLLSPLQPHFLSWWLSSQFLSSLLTHPLIVLRTFREHFAWVACTVAPRVFLCSFSLLDDHHPYSFFFVPSSLLCTDWNNLYLRIGVFEIILLI